MNLVRRIVEILIERFVGVVSTLFASRFETLAALEHAEQQNELEERARQFEDEGKPNLAAALRSRAAEISTESPAAMGGRVISELQHQHAQLEAPRVVQTPTTDDGPSAPPQSQASDNRRPAKRRSCRQPKTD